MTYLTRATLIHAATERAALNASAHAHSRTQGSTPPARVTNVTDPRSTVPTAIRELGERRRKRAARRTLTDKLATYTTPAEIQDLLATIEGMECDDAEAIRSILAGNLLQQQRTHQLASLRPLS